MLILGFLRSAAPFLRDGPIPTVVKRKKKTVGEESASEDEASRQEVIISEDEDTIPDSTHAQSSDGRGTILITLRNVHPYTEWSV